MLKGVIILIIAIIFIALIWSLVQIYCKVNDKMIVVNLRILVIKITKEGTDIYYGK